MPVNVPVNVEATVAALIWMLFGAAAVGIVAGWVRVPYAVALVLGGIVAAETHLVALPQLEPRVLLFVFLPPLLFDAAFRLDEKQLRVLVRPVLTLALPGTLVTAAIVGGVVALALRLPLAVGLLFGSIVAATDPVAVVSVFRDLRAPPHISVLAEGESLINDGIAITLYTALIGLVGTGTAAPLDAVGTFTREVFGGVIIGSGMGVAFSRLTGVIDDHFIEMTLSTVLAYGSYMIAQSLDASGALACVAAGLIHGSYGRQVGMSERTRQVLDELWEYFGFVANALVFLLVGFSANLSTVLGVGWGVAISIVAVVLSRVLVVVLPVRLVAASQAVRAVLIWGGLRGALTITLALALPTELPERQLLIALAFGVVLFTLLVQGSTLALVVRRAGLARDAG